MGNKKGFVFTVLAIAVLVLVLMSVNMWVRTYEQSEQNSAERFKGEAVRSVLSSVSSDSLSKFANASSFYAIYKLANFSAKNSQMGLPREDYSEMPDGYYENKGTARVEKYLISLMESGEVNDPDMPFDSLVYGDEEKSKYTLNAWENRVIQSAGMMGFNVVFSDPENFSVKQVTPWVVEVYFKLPMNISAKQGSMNQSTVLYANVTLPIEGFIDPMVTRGEQKHNIELGGIGTNLETVAVRQIWHKSGYKSPNDVKPIILADQDGTGGRAWEGYGWVFGQILSVGEAPPDPKYINQTILYVNRAEDIPAAKGIANSYGGVWVAFAPTVAKQQIIGPCSYTINTQTDCLNCVTYNTNQNPAGCIGRGEQPTKDPNTINVPLIVTTGVKSQDVDDVKLAGLGNDRSYVLFNNSESEPENKLDGDHALYDITNLRDMSICGFYVHDENEPAPSFFQRMLTDVPNDPELRSADLGIESFVIGQWAGGANDSLLDDYATDKYSRLDYEFYNTVNIPDAYRIKGMMGCKDEIMCNSKMATTTGVGVFRLSKRAAERYGVTGIAYDEIP